MIKKLKVNKQFFVAMFWTQRGKLFLSWLFLGFAMLLAACSYEALDAPNNEMVSIRKSPYFTHTQTASRISRYIHQNPKQTQCLGLANRFVTRWGVRWLQVHNEVRVAIETTRLFRPGTLSISREGYDTLVLLKDILQCYRISMIKITGYWGKGLGSDTIRKAFAQQRAHAVLKFLAGDHLSGRLIYVTQAGYDRHIEKMNKWPRVVIMFHYKSLFSRD